MVWIYAIKSTKDERIYVGMTKNIQLRLEQHNSGKTKSTKAFGPWVLIFYEKANSYLEARKKEKYYKSGIGKEYLKTNYGPVVQRIE